MLSASTPPPTVITLPTPRGAYGLTRSMAATSAGPAPCPDPRTAATSSRSCTPHSLVRRNTSSCSATRNVKRKSRPSMELRGWTLQIQLCATRRRSKCVCLDRVTSRTSVPVWLHFSAILYRIKIPALTLYFAVERVYHIHAVMNLKEW
ncbi:hypothetical protein BV22DRAFT_918213, partial [Leucogyrophana mollusca]